MATQNVALVTGSGKHRIGYYIVEALARRGYALAIHYRTSATEANQAVDEYRGRSVQAIAIQADLSKEKEVQTLMRTTLDRFGRIDLLVTCAAMWDKKPLEEVTAADLRQNFEVNTIGTFLCAQQAGLAMVKQKQGGCIVTVGDWATHLPYVNYSAYLASKGAIPTITRTLAVELGTRNPAVRVNCILPGPVMLPPNLPETERRQAISGTLVQREGKPENIAQAVMFFLDNDFVTGVCLPVDGGRSVFAPDALK